MATSVTQKREKTLPDKMQEAAQTYSYLRVPTAAKGKSKAGPLVLSGARNKWETKGEKNFIYQPTLRMAGTREELMAWLQNPAGGQQSASGANNYIQNSFTWENHNRSDQQIMIGRQTTTVKEAYENELAALKTYRSQQSEKAASAPKVDLNDLAVLLQSLNIGAGAPRAGGVATGAPKKGRTTDIASKFAGMAADKVLDISGFTATGTGARTIPRPAATSNKSSLDPTGQDAQLSRVVFDFSKDRTPAVQFLMAMNYPQNEAIQYLNRVAPQTMIPQVGGGGMQFGGGMNFNQQPQNSNQQSQNLNQQSQNFNQQPQMSNQYQPPRVASPVRGTSPQRGGQPPLPTLPSMQGRSPPAMPQIPSLPGLSGTSPMRAAQLPGLPGLPSLSNTGLPTLPNLH